MVGRRGAHLDGEANPRTARQLIGMHPKAETVGAPGFEDLASRVGTERAFLAENVAPLRLRRAGGEHRAGDEPDVLVHSSPVFRRHHMGAEVGHLLGYRRGHLEAPRFVSDSEAIARLGLERRGALSLGFSCQPGGSVPENRVRSGAVAATVVDIPPAS